MGMTERRSENTSIKLPENFGGLQAIANKTCGALHYGTEIFKGSKFTQKCLLTLVGKTLTMPTPVHLLQYHLKNDTGLYTHIVADSHFTCRTNAGLNCTSHTISDIALILQNQQAFKSALILILSILYVHVMFYILFSLIRVLFSLIH